ncbi:hypothetical protein QT944_021295, partial [Xanthomonas campestris pv. campestris]|uniref:hypothetical protein n=1 Tax=Xanthomonas campestris TaxID=339 RepID=UPI00358DDE93
MSTPITHNQALNHINNNILLHQAAQDIRARWPWCNVAVACDVEQSIGLDTRADTTVCPALGQAL